MIRHANAGSAASGGGGREWRQRRHGRKDPGGWPLNRVTLFVDQRAASGRAQAAEPHEAALAHLLRALEPARRGRTATRSPTSPRQGLHCSRAVRTATLHRLALKRLFCLGCDRDRCTGCSITTQRPSGSTQSAPAGTMLRAAACEGLFCRLTPFPSFHARHRHKTKAPCSLPSP